MKQNPKKGQVKGSVLLTVVGVMLVMVVFLMSTLTLTTASQKRSYYTYFETQAQYAAQAALDAITNVAYTNQEFYNFIKNLDTATKDMPVESLPKIDVDFSQSELHLSSGRVTCYAQYVGSYYVWSSKANKIETETAYRIIARAEVGSGKNATSATVANFVYTNEQEVAAVSTPISGKDNATSFYLTENFNKTTSTSVVAGPNPTNPTTAYQVAIKQMGALSAGNNQGGSMGPVNYNADCFPFSTQAADNETYNDNFMGGGGGDIIGNMVGLTGQTDYVMQSPGEGFRFYGDISCSKAPSFAFCADISDKFPITKYIELPYIYVAGTVSAGSGSGVRVGSGLNYSTANPKPVNMYWGAINFGNGSQAELNGDLYLMDPTKDSTYSGDNKTTLTRFVENNITKQSNGVDQKPYVGGNLICNNKSLTLTGDVRHVGGDLIMTNPESTLTINTKVTIEGALVCAGNLNVNQEVTANGGVYAQNAKTSWNNGKINQKTSLTEACDAATDGNTQKKAKIDSINFNDSADSYAALVTKILNYNSGNYNSTYTGTKYNLFPYGSRLDEIHERYILWDKPFDTSEAAQAYCDRTGSDADSRILESKACGNHVWKSISRESKAGTKYFPSTTPTNSAQNAFIPELKTVDSTQQLKDLTYFTSKADLLAGVSADSKAGMDSYQPKTGQNVKVVTHTNTGGDTDLSISGCTVIENSCELNLGDGNSTKYYFVNPNAKGYSNAKPMVIVLHGCIGNCRIIVNNTASYTTEGGQDYSNPQSYATLKTPADRQQVIFFWDNDMTLNNSECCIITTGLYHSWVNKGQLDVVSNPIYPNDGKWTSVPDTFKYKYELVPNITIMGCAKTYSGGEQVPIMNANILMPKSILDFKTSNYQPTVVYYETNDSAGVKWTKTKPISFGSMVIGGFNCTNIPLTVYIGDAFHPSTDSHTETYTSYSGNKNDSTLAGNENTVRNGGDNYLSNDHRAAG